MAAGEAQWQIGIVETHIRLLKNQLSLTDTVHYSGGLELNVPVKWKNRDLEKIDQTLNDD